MRLKSFPFLKCGLPLALSLALAQSNPIPPGSYESKALGQDGLYTFSWVFKSDGSYEFKMTSNSPRGKQSHMHGRYRISGDSIYLRGNHLKDGDEWRPYRNDVYTFTPLNDTTYRIRIMQDNEMNLVLKSKER